MSGPGVVGVTGRADERDDLGVDVNLVWVVIGSVGLTRARLKAMTSAVTQD